MDEVRAIPRAGQRITNGKAGPMPDYTLYYWPAPFRGEFVRAVLEHAGADWEEAGPGPTAENMRLPPAEQPVPHMGPPVLIDHTVQLALSQMPAILGYLAGKHTLMPGDPARAALTDKIVADANDVLYEMTRHNGAQMWTEGDWDAYRPRLRRWMEIFEETGRRYGMTAEEGHLLGTDRPGLADLAAATLWSTMTEKLPPLRPLLDAAAPALAGLTDRVSARPEQAALRARRDARYGETWCGGEIEASLRAVI